MSRCQLKRRARSRMLARKTAKLLASPSNLPSSGDIALLYSFVAVALVLGSSKLRMAWERPRPKAKAGAGGAGPAKGGGCGKGGRGGGGGAPRLLLAVQEEPEQEEPFVLGSYSLAVVVLGVHERVELV